MKFINEFVKGFRKDLDCKETQSWERFKENLKDEYNKVKNYRIQKQKKELFQVMKELNKLSEQFRKTDKYLN